MNELPQFSASLAIFARDEGQPLAEPQSTQRETFLNEYDLALDESSAVLCALRVSAREWSGPELDSNLTAALAGFAFLIGTME